MMDVGPYSRKRILETMANWHVPNDYAQPLYNYLVWGLPPGGFFTSVLANDWAGAIQRSHPNNTIEALKAATGWIYDYVPLEARGSYEAVDAWCDMDTESRKAILLERHLVRSDKEETVMALKGVPTNEPIFY